MSNFVDLQFNENVLKIKQNGGVITFKYHAIVEEPIDVFNQKGKDISTFAGLKNAWDEWASGVPNEFTLIIGGETYALSENSVHFHPHGDINSERVGTFDFYYKIPASKDTEKWRKVVLRVKLILDKSLDDSMSLTGGVNSDHLRALGVSEDEIRKIGSVISGLSTYEANLINSAFEEILQNQTPGICTINPSVVPTPTFSAVNPLVVPTPTFSAVNPPVVSAPSSGISAVNPSVVSAQSSSAVNPPVVSAPTFSAVNPSVVSAPTFSAVNPSVVSAPTLSAVNPSVVSAPSSSAVNLPVVPAPVPAYTHLTETFRKLVTPAGEFGGVGGTNENPIGYVNFNDPGSAEQLLYFKVPTIHTYTKTDSTIDTLCFKLPSGLIDNLPDYIKDRKNLGYDNEFYFVITCINFDLTTAFGGPDKALLQRPHYYYMGNRELDVDENANWSSGALDFNLEYSHGVWGEGLTVGDRAGGAVSSPIINNTDLSNLITRHSIHAHDHLISPPNSYFYLNDVVDNTDINKTIWTFVTGQDDATSDTQRVGFNGVKGPIKFNKNRKNVFTLHWLLDPTKFEDLKTSIHSGTINNLQDLYGQSLALGLLTVGSTNHANVRVALGI